MTGQVTEPKTRANLKETSMAKAHSGTDVTLANRPRVPLSTEAWSNQSEVQNSQDYMKKLPQ